VKIYSYAVWMLLAFAAPVFGQIPNNAVSATNLNSFDTWHWTHDPATHGSASGSSSYPASPSLDGLSREFAISYSAHGGEIYHVTFGYDTTAKNFVYDTYVYFENPSQVANLELDLNQVLADGKTVIMGTQCSAYSGTWEYTVEYGGSSHWRPSNVPCNPKKWTANKWHHIQIAMHRDDSGVVTHDWVAVDGGSRSFSNAVGQAGHYLGWATGHLILNFQVDGASAGSGYIKGYFDKMHVYRW
jgi:hypothetical protein